MREPPPFSSFDRLIENLADASDQLEDAPRPAHPFSIDSLEAAWDVAAIARAMPTKLAGSTVKGRNYSYDGEPAPEISLDTNGVLKDLGFPDGVTSEADAILARREFALRNHPDRLPPELRKAATERMMIANALVDQHIARLRKSARR